MKRKPKNNKINKKEFAKEFVKTGNATQAYKNVSKGVTNRTAETQASQLLKKPEIQKHVVDALADAGLTPDKITKYMNVALLSGLGKKATNKDAIKVMEIALKYYQNPQEVEEGYEDKDYKELISIARETKNKLNVLMREAQEGEVVG